MVEHVLETIYCINLRKQLKHVTNNQGLNIRETIEMSKNKTSYLN